MKVRDESGQALILTALGFSIILGFVGLAIDSGLLFRAKRNMQIAADAAATAGALDYLYNGSKDSAKTAAQSVSGLNGYTDGTGNVTVTVNTPPTSGASSGVSGFTEVVVAKPVPMTFMALLGFSTVQVKARAVAGTPTAGTACIWLLDKTGVGMDLQGSFDIEATQCGIYINSTSSNAVSITGNGGTLNALFADTVGSSVGHQTTPTPITTHTAPRTNPWGDIKGPNPTNGSGCTTVDNTTTSLSGTLSGPGAGNTVCYTKAVTLTNATFGSGSLGSTIATTTVSSPAGTLVFGNGVTFSGTVTVYGGTIDVYNGTFNQPSNTIVNVVAPTSGTYNGIAIMQPSNNNSQLQIQKGSNNQVLDGYIYAPAAEVFLQDSGGGVTATGIVADSMFDKTTKIVIPSYDKAHPSTTPNRVLTLLE